LRDHPPETNLSFYIAVGDHLSRYEICIRSLWKERDLQEAIKEIYFLIHQAYIELGMSTLN
jgi:hypothetical protein